MMEDNQDMIKESMAPYPSVTEKAPWKILIVDDEIEVHRMTRLVLSDVEFNNRALSFLSALSAREARNIMENHPDIAIVLLDVVMETDNAGLELVTHIRDVLKNDRIRIIVRSGQTGSVSEQDIISRYGIDDYKSKLELTNEKLNISIISSLKAFQKSQEMFHRIVDLEAEIKEKTKGNEDAAINNERDSDDEYFKRTVDKVRKLVGKAEREKKSFVAMSSEIITPLNSVLEMAADLLKSDLNTTQKELVQNMHETCNVLKATIKDNSFKVDLKKKRQTAPHPIFLPTLIKRNKILVVMEDDLPRQALVRHLEALDYKAVDVETGDHAMDVITQAAMEGKPFSVVIVGLDSPVMGSTDFARNLKTRIPDHKPFIIAIKTTCQDFIPSSLEKNEFDAYIFKFVSEKTLANVLDSLKDERNGGGFGKASKVFSITKKQPKNELDRAPFPDCGK